jgi:hypothetical protein
MGGDSMIRGTMEAGTLRSVALPRLDGGELNLGETGGKRQLLFMWASW